MISVKFDTRALHRLANSKLPHIIYRTVLQMAHAVEADYTKTAPKHTGDMASSASVEHGVTSKDHPRAILKVNARNDDGAPYPAFNEFGTGMRSEDWNGAPLGTRHVIYPRRSDAMQWTWAGSTYYRRYTMGTYPSHALRKALDRVWDKRRRIIHGAVQQRI